MNFFKQFAFLSVCIFVLASTGSLRAEEFAVYENKAAGLKLRHPAAWVQDEKVPGVLVAFGAPKEKANLDLVENVTLMVHDVTPETSTLEKYTQKYVAELASDTSDAKIVESHETVLAGLPAHRIVCVGKHGKFDIQFSQIWALNKGKAYLCTYGAPKATYPKFLSEAEGIMASLEFV